MSDYRKAWDAATKEGDIHMRCYGGTEWSKEDLHAAHDELVRQVEKLYGGMDKQMRGLGQSAAGNETG